MTSRDTHQLAHAVIDILTDRRCTNATIHTNPTGYRREVRREVRSQHWARLIELIDSAQPIRSRALADLLEPGNAPRPDPQTAMQAARADEWDRHALRLAGHCCPTCQGTTTTVPDRQPDGTLAPATPCPDCNGTAAETRSAS